MTKAAFLTYSPASLPPLISWKAYPVPVSDRFRCARLLAAVVLTATAMIGCALFGPSEDVLKEASPRAGLPVLRPASNAIQLQVVFIERPSDDALASHLVWQELDQIGALPPATRTLLIDNGFRVGQTGASPPPALQTLLGLTEEVASDDASEERLMRGRRMGLRSGQETELLTNEAVTECRMTFAANGQEDTLEYHQARCLFRLKPIRQQDGWVRLEFTPEIHHGDARMRPTPNDDGWSLRGGQKVDVRHGLKFSVTLSTGEFVVVGCDGKNADLPGPRFFRRETEKSGDVQRLLVVRVADAGMATAGDSTVNR